MKLIKFSPTWSSIMVKKVGSNSKKENKPLLKLTIAPTTDETALCPFRIKEIQDLVAEIIILGTKRGRPSIGQGECKDVA